MPSPYLDKPPRSLQKAREDVARRMRGALQDGRLTPRDAARRLSLTLHDLCALLRRMGVAVPKISSRRAARGGTSERGDEGRG